MIKALRRNKTFMNIVHLARWNCEYFIDKAFPACGSHRVRATWCDINNWGDSLNPFLINAISGSTVHLTHNPKVEKYLVIGSIIEMMDENTIVWGAGCLESSSKIVRRPKHICAVRGPLTRKVLLENGIDAPAVYGDPVLLMPRFYNPAVDVRYDVGIVPHYVDKNNQWLEQYMSDDKVTIIDIQSEALSFVDQIKQCRHIISSSLHGIICADAYGIPATWVEFSDSVLGNGFKFFDYFRSIQRTAIHRIHINDESTVWSILDQHSPYSFDIDLDLLYNACPFKNE
jgi:pyruvyltransferase